MLNLVVLAAFTIPCESGWLPRVAPHQGEDATSFYLRKVLCGQKWKLHIVHLLMHMKWVLCIKDASFTHPAKRFVTQELWGIDMDISDVSHKKNITQYLFGTFCSSDFKPPRICVCCVFLPPGATFTPADANSTPGAAPTHFTASRRDFCSISWEYIV